MAEGVERLCQLSPLNESPSEKEGKSDGPARSPHRPTPLNESPSEKEGKSPSRPQNQAYPQNSSLNESPSEKEGKCGILVDHRLPTLPSMKVPPKRKGNWVSWF